MDISSSKTHVNIHICNECRMEFPEGVGFEDPRLHECVRDESPKAQAYWERYDKMCERDKDN